MPTKFSAHEIVKKTEEKEEPLNVQEGAGSKVIEASNKRKLAIDEHLLHSMSHPVIKTEDIIIKKPKLPVTKTVPQSGQGQQKKEKIKHKLQLYN